MGLLEDYMGFVHIPSGRTGYICDGPWGTYDHDGPRDERGRKQYVEGSVFYEVRWDDTGETGDAFRHEIRSIPKAERHITDGTRVCHCGPSTIECIVIHRGKEEKN